MFKRKRFDYDLIVIGSGAGGSVGAHYARSLGKKVALFEKGEIGGECPNFACVPTKALLHSADMYETIQHAHSVGVHAKAFIDYEQIHKRKDLVVSRTGASHGASAFENDGIHVVKHKATFISPDTVEAGGHKYSADRFLIATGSSVLIPPIPGLKETGYITFKQAVDLHKPPESLFIIGGGVVACEFAQIFSIFGSKVTIAARSTLLSNEDREVVDLVQALFEYRNIKVLNSVTVTKIEKKDHKKRVYYSYGAEEEFQDVDEILVATGKVPVLDFAPENAHIKTSHAGIVVNKYLQTTNSRIFAAGDVIGPFLFTHSGYYQSGVAVQNAFKRQKVRVDYRTVPRCVFITPEVASVGITEQQAKVKCMEVKKGLAAISILGRANTSEEFDGFVKVITDKKDVIIGAAIVAPRAGELIHELALAVELRVKAQVIANMIHAYPTYSEAVKIACSNVE